jgi:hypothetical protein
VKDSSAGLKERGSVVAEDMGEISSCYLHLDTVHLLGIVFVGHSYYDYHYYPF